MDSYNFILAFKLSKPSTKKSRGLSGDTCLGNDAAHSELSPPTSITTRQSPKDMPISQSDLGSCSIEILFGDNF